MHAQYVQAFAGLVDHLMGDGIWVVISGIWQGLGDGREMPAKVLQLDPQRLRRDLMKTSSCRVMQSLLDNALAAFAKACEAVSADMTWCRPANTQLMRLQENGT